VKAKHQEPSAAVSSGGRVRFFRLRHDDPEPEHLADTEQGLLARLFVPLIQSPRATPGGLRQAAEAAVFLHLDELLAWHEAGGDGPFPARLGAFVAGLDQRVSE
jgi:hypothetical protein